MKYNIYIIIPLVILNKKRGTIPTNYDKIPTNETHKFIIKLFSDINECLEDHSCSDRANCINTDGSFTCVCKQGYSGEFCQGSVT